MRPRVEPADLFHGGVEFDGEDGGGRLRGHDGRVSQPHRRVQHVARHLAHRLNFVERVLVWVAIHNAVHGDARDEHGRGAVGGVEGVGALQFFGEEVDFAQGGTAVFTCGDVEAGVFAFGHLFHQRPIEHAACGQVQASGREVAGGEGAVEVEGDGHGRGSRFVGGEERDGLDVGEGDEHGRGWGTEGRGEDTPCDWVLTRGEFGIRLVSQTN